MTTYRVQGTAQEDSVGASHMVIAYKADRGTPGTLGEELGRARADGAGNWFIDFENWTGDVTVVMCDMTPGDKFKAKVKDWVLGTVQGTPTYSYKTYERFLVDDLGAAHLWKLDEANGTSIVDSIGSLTAAMQNAASATYQQTGLDADSFGIDLQDTAYLLPGIMSAPDSPNQVFTIACNIKALGGTTEMVWGIGNGATNRIFLFFDTSTTTFGLAYGSSADMYGVSNYATYFGDNKWHTLLVEIHEGDYASSRIWVDGAELTLSVQKGTPSNLVPANWSIGIGASPYTTDTSRFDGQLSRFCVIPRALTADETFWLHAALAKGYVNNKLVSSAPFTLANLQGYWPLNSLSDPTTQYDLSGKKRSGTLVNSPATFTGPFYLGGKGRSFNGTNQYINNLGTVADFSFIQNTAVFTLMCWFKVDDPEANRLGAFFGNTTASNQKGFWVGYENRSIVAVEQRGLRLGVLRGASGSALYSRSYAGAVKPGDTAWHHVAWTADGTANVLMYLDGAYWGAPTYETTVLTFPTGNSNYTLNIGRNNSTTVYYHQGKLEAPMIFSSTLSAASVLEIYNEQKVALALAT